MTIERPMFPPRAEIIRFPGPRPVARQFAPTPDEPTEPVERFPETPRQRAGRKRNPYREPCHRISYAVTIAGQLHRNEAMHSDIDHIAILRKGMEAAARLTVELARILEQEG